MARDTVTVPREVLVETLAFIESEMHWSQPAPDMGEEPSNQFTYDAIPVAMALREALSSSDPEGGARGGRVVQESIATKQATDETAASVLSEPPEAWADCETCGGEGAINRTIHVYENGCGFSHPDVEIIPCTDCMGTGGAIVDAASTYCDICGGDCSSANPPVFNCPLAKQESRPESAPRTETASFLQRASDILEKHLDPDGGDIYIAHLGSRRAIQIVTAFADEIASIATRSAKLIALADAIRAAQRAYMADRGNHEKGKAVAAAAAAYDASRTKSAPPFLAPHNSGEREPPVMPDSGGADTKSDGGAT